MAANCPEVLDLCAIRVSRLSSATGSPVPGAGNAVISNAPIKLDVKLDLEKGDDLVQKNGCGLISAAFHDRDRLKSVLLSMDLTQLDATLFELMTGAQVFNSGGNPIGFQSVAVGVDGPSPVCLEAWSKAWDGGSPAVPAFTTPNAAYIHWVFPKTTFHQSDFTAAHGFVTLGVDGKGEENPRITANGPFDDWPAGVSGPGGITRCYGWFYDATLPTASCGYTSVPSAAS